jgi:hypothetical protein
MEVHLGAGAVVDLATSDEISKSTSSLVDAITKGSPQPLRFTQMGQKVGQSTDPIDLGSPPIGRMWFILSLTLCVGDMAAYHPGHIRVPAIAIPTYRTTSSDGLWVHPNENVYVITGSIPALQQIVVNIQVEEWNQAEISMNKPGFTPLA